MTKKLKCVLVDDDPFIHSVFDDFCKISQYAELVAKFECPKKFLEALPNLDFDICLLDIMMMPIDGFTVAQMLKGKPVIFITGGYGKVPEALGVSPVDVLLKPIWGDRFERSMEKAYYMLLGKKVEGTIVKRKTHEMFWVAELLGKVKLPLADILYVKTDELDHRNKQLWMADGKKYTIMDHTLYDLMDVAPHLLQANISELISRDSFHCIEHGVIVLKGVNEDFGGPKKVKLGRAYKKDFFRQFTLN